MRDNVIIRDILEGQYPSFLTYCEEVGKVFVHELDMSDYIAYRMEYGVGREEANDIKSYIDNKCYTEFEKSTSNGSVEENYTIKKCKDGNTTAIGEKSSEDQRALGSLFDVHADDYDAFSIDFLRLSVRPINVLRNNSIDSIGQLLRLSIEKLSGYNNMGCKSVEEVYNAVNNFINASRDSNNENQSFRLNSRVEEYQRERMPLYLGLGVNVDDFRSFSIGNLGLSARPYRVLIRHGISTISDLLEHSMEELIAFRSMGSKSLEEIYNSLSNFIETPSFRSKANFVPLYELLGVNISDFDNIVIDKLELPIEKTQVLKNNNINNICDLLNCDVAFIKTLHGFGSKDIDNIINLVRNLLKETEIRNVQEKTGYTKEKFNHVITRLNNYKFKPFIRAFWFSHREFPVHQEQVSELYDIEYIGQLDYDLLLKSLGITNLVVFIDWLDFDINTILQLVDESVFKNKKSAKDILLKRSNGATLVEIGEELQVTRERVRQIEAKSVFSIRKVIAEAKYDIIYLIHALRNGDDVIQEKEFKEILDGDYGRIFWYMIKNGEFDCTEYKYHDETNCIVFSGDDKSDLSDNIDSIISNMPDYILDNHLDKTISDYAAKYNISDELLKLSVLKTYRKQGRFLSKSKFTVAFMCSYILKKYFKAGFKIADEIDYEIFIKKFHEFFGDYNLTTRALDAKIPEVGILCDRGKYIHTDYINVSIELVKRIEDFINDSPKDTLSYSEIYESCSDFLLGTPVVNRFYLQGILKKYSCAYDGDRDYIKKNSNLTFVDELDKYMNEKGCVYSQELLEDFPGLTLQGLHLNIPKCSNIITCDNGLLIHASTLSIRDEDYEFLEKYILDACERKPIGSRLLHDMLSYDYVDFMVRNEINDHGKLFGILKYMFSDKFTFSRPYISLKTTEKLATRDVLLKWLSDYESLSLDEFFEICNDAGIKIQGFQNMFDQIKSDFVRISEDTIIRLEKITITDEIIERVQEMVSDKVESEGFVPSAAITDYSWYPTLEYPWNPFLIESVLSFSQQPIPSLKLSFGNYKYPLTIYLSERFKDYDLEQLFKEVLITANEEKHFKNKNQVLCYLQEQKLCYSKLPGFLTRSGFLASLGVE